MLFSSSDVPAGPVVSTQLPSVTMSDEMTGPGPGVRRPRRRGTELRSQNSSDAHSDDRHQTLSNEDYEQQQRFVRYVPPGYGQLTTDRGHSTTEHLTGRRYNTRSHSGQTVDL